ncbi:MAG: DUF4836 family protein [Prevotella sp.]|uniref:DUF4836 family protein n=1 Tax=Prevotella sp. TaxID=59823 RepID=UPI002A2D2D65|nr:DUF4836 family protein [Prevotella sp.]MDD7318274.1 DUF4836 family protein [Prevotellaceae bacterium]MDY4019722.1 DUF4836 family protein [Prevotella sp.]
MMKILLRIIVATFLLPLVSCSEKEYLNVIPRESVAVISVDAQRLSTLGNSGIDNALKSLLGVDNTEGCGVDFSSKIYLFETPDGALGLVARVESADEMTEWLSELSVSGKCTVPEEHLGNMFVTIGNSWFAGYSDEALVLVGPVSAMQRAETRQRLQKMFRQTEEQGVRETQIFKRLELLDAPIAFVSRLSALPEKMSLPFALFTPKEADASQIILSATVDKEGELMVIRGETMSFNEKINSKLQENNKVLRPITKEFFGKLSPDCIGSMFMNVEGERLLKLMQQSKEMQPLLVGVNTSIDMDNILRAINGDMVLYFSSLEGDFDFIANLKNKDFLADVGYWKTSCPAGSSITNAGKDAYLYTNGGMVYSFAVDTDNHFISSLRHNKASTAVTASAPKPLPKEIAGKIEGSTLAMLIDLGNIDDETVGNIVKSLFGGASKILYIKE